MIAFLEGRVIERRGAELVVKVVAGPTSQGVGYSVIAGGPGFLDVAEDDLVSMWIHSITKETGTTLYGFSTRGARDQFVELLGVDGVGPKIAMAIVNAGANPRELSSLVGIKGVGAKTAAKIVEQLGAAA